MVRVRPLTVAALTVLCAAALAAQTPRAGHAGPDLSGADRTVRPQDDLFRFVNGGWLARAEIPGDRTTYGTFLELADAVELDLRAILESTAALPHPHAGSATQQIGDFYRSAMDVARIDALGAEPARPELARIAAIRSPHDVAVEAGALTALGAGGPFGVTLAVDVGDASRLLVQVSQGGTLLPSREAYVASDAVAIRQEYHAYLTTMFRLAGEADPDGAAGAALQFEIALARAQLGPVESRRAAADAPQLRLTDLAATYPGFDWAAWAAPQGVQRAAAISLLQPAFFHAFAALVPDTPLDTLKAWLAARYLTAMSPYLSEPFAGARFAFFGATLTGQTVPRPRWQIAVSVVSSFLGDSVGKLYVLQHFPAPARARAERVVATVVRAYRDVIEHCDWLSRVTRTEAIDKLTRLTAVVGAPDAWRTYPGLEIAPDDYFGNVQRARRFEGAYRLARLTGRVGAGESVVSAQTVNAFYNAALNQIFLPAAILQPPHFDAAADDAVNFGALGATVAHEITHALDAQGRRFDAQGQVRRWWTEGEEREMQQRSLALVGQYGAYRPLPDLGVNGDLTLDENVADLAGLTVAYRAYQLTLDGKPAPVVDGLTGDQRFFLSYARMWRLKMRESYERQWLLTLPYAPYEYRTNGPVSNLAAFYAAFQLAPGDRLFRSADERARIW